MLGRTSEEVFIVLHFIFVSSFCCCSLFAVVLHSHLLFDIISHPSVDYSRVFTPILYFQPSPLQSDSQHFDFQLFWSVLIASALILSGRVFKNKRFLPYAPSPTFLTQPAFIKASLEAGSSSLKDVRLH